MQNNGGKSFRSGRLHVFRCLACPLVLAVTIHMFVMLSLLFCLLLLTLTVLYWYKMKWYSVLATRHSNHSGEKIPNFRCNKSACVVEFKIQWSSVIKSKSLATQMQFDDGKCLFNGHKIGWVRREIFHTTFWETEWWTINMHILDECYVP